MAEHSPSGTVSRQQRRRDRTRAALITAAQSFLAEGNVDVSIQALTERADLGFGTFYNHFASKDELIAAAQEDAFGRYGAWLSRVAGPQEDTVASLAIHIRLTGRLALAHPELAKVIAHSAGARGPSNQALHPWGMEAIHRAAAARDFADEVEFDTTVAMIGAAVTAVLRAAVHAEPATQPGIADICAKNVLLMLEIDAERIRDLLGRPVRTERPSSERPGGREDEPGR